MQEASNLGSNIRKRTNTKTKESSSAPKICDSSSDLFGQIMGPSIDDSILTSWQTMLDLCNCQKSGESDEDERIEVKRSFGSTQTSKTNIINRKLQTHPPCRKTTMIQTSKCSKDAMIQTTKVCVPKEHDILYVPDYRSSSDEDCICRQNVCQCAQENFKIGDGECIPNVRYAVARITKYDKFTTYEIMKSTQRPPKHIPQYMEGIFVLRKRR